MNTKRSHEPARIAAMMNGGQAMSYHMTREQAELLASTNPSYEIRKYLNRHDNGADTSAGRTFGVWNTADNHWVFNPNS